MAVHILFILHYTHRHPREMIDEEALERVTINDASNGIEVVGKDFVWKCVALYCWLNQLISCTINSICAIMYSTDSLCFSKEENI